MPNAIDTLRLICPPKFWPHANEFAAALADVEELLQAAQLIGSYEIATKGRPHVQIRAEYLDALAAAVRNVTGEEA